MRPIRVSYSPSILDRDGIALAQTPAGAGDLTLNGTFVSSGVATLGDQQVVGIYSGSNISNRTFDVYGYDKNMNAVSQTGITGPNATTVSTTVLFYQVTRVAISGAAAGDVEVGTTGLGSSAPYPLDLSITPPSIAVAIQAVTGGTYKMQYTYDNIWVSGWITGTQNWTDDSNMTGKTGAYATVLTALPQAIRFVITTAGSPQGISGNITQAGMSGM